MKRRYYNETQFYKQLTLKHHYWKLKIYKDKTKKLSVSALYKILKWNNPNKNKRDPSAYIPLINQLFG